uniref:IRF tryptophan pentad repeat domain-containing protein n=1 Tax=Capra hircus TaxID=9925 RepID=A0A8C2P0V0_CAPHI
MASGRMRCTRKLRNWVVEQVESGQFPGVCWEDAAKTMFRIPWKHAGLGGIQGEVQGGELGRPCHLEDSFALCSQQKL